MRTIVALTDVLAHENRFPKGTGFTVKSDAKPGTTPPQIDPRTAGVWLQNEWAKEEPAKAKTNAG